MNFSKGSGRNSASLMTDLMQESKLTMMQRRVRRIFFLIHFNMFFYLHHLLGTL